MPGRVVCAVVIALSLALAACGEAPPAPTRAVPSTATVAPSPTPARVRANGPDTIAIGVADLPAGLGTPPNDGPAARLFGNVLFSRLVGVDDRLEPYPDLVEDLATIENGGARFVGTGDGRQLQTTFRLRAGARWSDGAPVTARDVVFSWELAQNPHFGATISTESRYERVEAIDERTVVLTFFSERSAREAAHRRPNRHGFLADQRGPVVDPLYVLGLPNTWIYPAHVLSPLLDGVPRESSRLGELFTSSAFARAPVGSGPYALQEWRPGDRAIFAARADYHRGAPAVRTLLFQVGANPAADPRDTLVERLRDGRLDVLPVDETGPNGTAGLVGMPGVWVLSAPSTAVERLDVNLDHPALRDARVRRALALALDRRVLAEAALGSPPGETDGIAPDLPHDPAAAARLIGEAGWTRGSDGVWTLPDGQRLSLRLVTTDTPPRRAVAAAIARQLGATGVDVAVDARPPDELFAPRGVLARREFDLALYATVGGFDRLGDLLAWFHPDAIPRRANAYTGENYPGYTGGGRLWEQANGQLERAARRELAGEIERQVLDDLPTVPLFVYPRSVGVSAQLRGVRPPLAPIGITWNVAEWRIE